MCIRDSHESAPQAPLPSVPPPPLYSMSFLESLDLTGLALVGDRAITAMARSCGPRLKQLHLSGCARITDTGISALARFGCAGLEVLNLAGCPLIGDASLCALGGETGPHHHHHQSTSPASSPASSPTCRKLPSCKVGPWSSLRVLNLFKCLSLIHI